MRVLDERVISYAQNREDIILSAFFPGTERGFYVDVGAHHPTADTVTKYFYDRGWYGINIEPNKKLYKLLVSERPNDINLNTGVADKKGELVYREYPKGDGLSTFSKAMQEVYKNSSSVFTEEYVDHTISVTTLKKIFEAQKVQKIDFLKIDIEGFEYEALVGNDWKNYRPEVICIEANHIVKNWKPLLKDNGYKLVFFDGLNEYYASNPARAAKFSYVEGVLSKPIIYYQDYEQLLRFQNLKKKYKHMMAKHADREHDLIGEIVYRDTIIKESRRFINSLIIFLHAFDNIILQQINRFNHPKRKHATKNIEVVIPKGADRKSLLQVARENDLRNFYTISKGSGKFEKQYVYSTLLFMYKKSKKILRLLLKGMYRLVRFILGKNTKKSEE